LSVTLPTTADTNAPERSMPSIAMLMTPERSQRMPDSAPKTIGTARWIVLCRIPVRFIDWLAATQVRNAKMNATVTRARMSAVRAPKPRVSWMAAAKATTPPST
jgi:hypothetical protein